MKTCLGARRNRVLNTHRGELYALMDSFGVIVSAKLAHDQPANLAGGQIRGHAEGHALLDLSGAQTDAAAFDARIDDEPLIRASP